MIISIFCAFAFVPTTSGYDGPVGVTFRSLFIENGAGIDVVVLEGISVQEKVRIDDNWSLKIEGKNRAFPDEFMATIADSHIIFRISNRGNRNVKTNILIPYDASDKIGTGFTEPLHIAVSFDGRPASIFRGPELARGMMKVRSYRVPAELPARSTITLTVTASHHLAVNPAWYQFICTDPYAKFPNHKSLTAAGCRLEFEFDPTDERLKPLKLQWKEAFQDKPLSEEKHEMIKFIGESVEWVRVFR